MGTSIAMKQTQSLLKEVTRSLAIAVSAFTALVLPTSAQALSEASCSEPVGDIEQLTLRIFDGATQDEIVDAFSRLNALSESGMRAAVRAYVGEIAGGNDPATVSLLVNDMSTCVRLVVI
jgi:hypothetical protein